MSWKPSLLVSLLTTLLTRIYYLVYVYYSPQIAIQMMTTFFFSYIVFLFRINFIVSNGIVYIKLYIWREQQNVHMYCGAKTCFSP